MRTGDIYPLPTDIFSMVNKRQYGAAGDSVKIISVRGEVLIVEVGGGFRFPIHINQLLTHGTEPGAETTPPQKEAERVEERAAPSILRTKKPLTRGGDEFSNEKAQRTLF